MKEARHGPSVNSTCDLVRKTLFKLHNKYLNYIVMGATNRTTGRVKRLTAGVKERDHNFRLRRSRSCRVKF